MAVMARGDRAAIDTQSKGKPAIGFYVKHGEASARVARASSWFRTTRSTSPESSTFTISGSTTAAARMPHSAAALVKVASDRSTRRDRSYDGR
jgi:hypothetical protein